MSHLGQSLVRGGSEGLVCVMIHGPEVFKNNVLLLRFEECIASTWPRRWSCSYGRSVCGGKPSCWKILCVCLCPVFKKLNVCFRVFGASLLSEEKTAGKHLLTSPTRHSRCSTLYIHSACWWGWKHVTQSRSLSLSLSLSLSQLPGPRTPPAGSWRTLWWRSSVLSAAP